MAVRPMLVMAGTTLVGVLGPVAPAVAQVLAQPDPAGAYTMSAGRLWSLVAALLGLAGAAIGALALARPTARIGRWGAIWALLAGLAGAAIGGLVVATAKGGPGTGYGIVGGYVALVIGLIAMTLGGLTLARHRRTG
ncbi:DUF6223 family protein [Nonomuraea glycinis]|uniref:Uncharacterized protein n=1 Tax=Nonomuraea glycinis TaxID=2047744 RepID=A0A918E8X8_9ACTN|nr:DUF6223 family protein [Nonomuraea glycinis]MCA2180940.1 DUF6223 family protein [Nonomuraea glycinis]GGP13060.1 hypothetical protein GCM10012278_63330 [Nonomuraea glycinis]